MQKFLKMFFNFNLIFLMVAPSVTACVEEGVKLSEITTNLNLGYLENLKKETIFNAFSQKNPRVDMKLISYEGASPNGNGYKYIISTQPPWNRGYRNSRVTVTFNSKLSFGNADNNVYPITFTNKNQVFTVPISILTNDYDPEKDDDFTFSSNVWNNNSWDFNYKLELDQTNKLYNFSISFNEKEVGKNEWRRNFLYHIGIQWGFVYLVEIEIYLNFK